MHQQMYSFLKDVPGWLTVHEGQFLTSAVLSVKRNQGEVVEIGSYCGKSTIWIALAGEKVYAIDPHKGEVSGGNTTPTLGVFLRNLSIAGVEKQVKVIKRTSEEASKFWRKKIKFLFIDGLHDYTHASIDYELWAPFIQNGGIIAMHDAFCGWQGAGRVAMRKIVNNSRFSEIGVVGSIIWGKRGKMTLLRRVLKLRFQIIISICQNIYSCSRLPNTVKYIIVHRILRVFLINRFSSFN